MPEVDPVTLRLFVDEGRAVASLNKYGRVADQQFSLVEKGARGVESALGSLKGVLAGVSAAALARSFLDIADTAKTLDAQLKLATAGFGSFNQAQADVRKIAASTRSGLEETASLYGNFTRNASELGITQEQAGRATETVTKAFKISGASAVDASQGTRQLVQALQSGVLRGDEFNTMAESAPRLQRLLADSLGVTQGELRKMAEAGELTASKLARAFTDKKFTAGIDAEFREMPVTFDQAMTQVNNAAIITFGAFDRGGQFSTALANFITQGTGGFADLEQSAESFGVSARANIEGLASAFAPVFAEAQRLFSYLSGGFAGVDIGRDIQKSLDQIDAGTKFLSGNTAIEKAVNKALTGRENLSTNFGGRFRETRARSERVRQGEIRETAVTNKISPYLDRFGNPVQRATPARPAGAGPSGAAKRTGGGTSAETAARRAESERLKAIRDEASKAREAAQLQDDINAAKAALATAANDVLAFNLVDIESQRSQRVNEFAAQAKLGKLTDKELADRTAAVNEIADLQRKRVQQIADEANRRDALDVAQSSNQNQQDIYRSELALIDAREDRYAVELRLVDLAYQQERAELEGVLASQTSSQAQKDIAAARLKILGRLQEASERAVDRQYESPLDQRRREVRETTANMGDQIEDIQLDALDRLTDGLADASTEYIKLGGVAGDVINGIIRDLVKLAAQQTIFGKGGGVGGILGSLGGLFGGGGVSAVNTGAIANAANSVRLPGFASGGYTGDGSRNQPAGIVHKGEYVIDAPTVQRIGVQNLAALTNARAAASMTGVTAAGAGASQMNGTIRVALMMDNDVFTARVQEASVPVAIEVVRQSGPGMVAAAKAQTIQDLGRSRM